MTDYHPLLLRAIQALERDTPEARQAVFNRARQMVSSHLRGMNPPASDERIKAEQAALEDAIWRVEMDTLGTNANAPKGKNLTFGLSHRRLIVFGSAGIATIIAAAIGWFVFWSGANLNGSVVDNFGKPVEGAEISIVNTAFKTFTDSNGRYRLEYIPGHFAVLYVKSGHVGTSITLDAAATTSFPVRDVVLAKTPPDGRLWLVEASDYSYINNCSIRVDNLGQEGERFSVSSGTPTTLLISKSTVFTFVDRDPPRTNLGMSTPAIFSINSGTEFYRVKPQGLIGSTQTGFRPALSEAGLQPIPGARWFSAQLTPGSYVYVGQGGFPGTGVLFPMKDSPCYYFRVINTPSDLISQSDDKLDKKDVEGALADLNIAIRFDPKLIDAYIARARVKSIKDDLDGAIGDASQAIKLKPDSVEAHETLGNVYARKSEFEKAISEFSEALRLNPKNSGIYVVRANAYEKSNKLDQAVADWSEFNRIEEGKGLVSLARLWEQKGDFNKAIALLTEQMERAPQEASVYRESRARNLFRKGDLAIALRDLDQAISAFHNISGYKLRADVLRAMKRPDEAIADYRKVITSYTDDTLKTAATAALKELGADTSPPAGNSDDLIRSANDWASKGERDRAIEDLNRAIAIEPRNDRAYSTRGSVWLLKAELDQAKTGYDNAVADFNKANEINPQNASALIGRGQAYLLRKGFDAALKDFNALIELNPKSGDFLIWRTVVLIAKGDRERASADFKRAHELTTNLNYQQNGLTTRAQYFRRVGLADLAIADCEEALRQNSKNVLAVVLLNQAWEQTATPDRGIEYFANRIRQNPSESDSFKGRARLLLRKGNLSDALHDADEAVRTNPRSYQAYEVRGDILRKMGRRPEAIESYQSAISVIDPQYSNLKVPIGAVLRELGAAPATTNIAGPSAVQKLPGNGWLINSGNDHGVEFKSFLETKRLVAAPEASYYTGVLRIETVEQGTPGVSRWNYRARCAVRPDMQGKMPIGIYSSQGSQGEQFTEIKFEQPPDNASRSWYVLWWAACKGVVKNF